METNNGIFACSTCGAEYPDHTPLYDECDFLRSRERLGASGFCVNELPRAIFDDVKSEKTKKPNFNPRLAKILITDGRNPSDREDWNEEENFIRRAEEDSEWVRNSPTMSDSEKRIALCDIRRRRVERRLENHRLECETHRSRTMGTRNTRRGKAKKPHSEVEKRSRS